MRGIVLYGTGLLLWLGGLVSLLSPRLEWIELSYRLPQLQARYLQQREENARLRAQRAQLRSAERIETIARQELGMILPQAGQVISVEERSRGSQRSALSVE